MQDQIVITTRPIDDAQQDIADLKEMMITALVAPMLEIQPLTTAAKPASSVDAIVVTSRHAPPLLDASLHHLPCYCVGGSTANASHDAGFQNVITGGGDGQALAKVIHDHQQSADHPTKLDHVFWPSAVDTGFNIADALAAFDITTDRQPVYKAATTNHWPDDIDNAIRQGKVAAVLMHSGRAGEHFAKLMDARGLSPYRENITAIVISNRAAGLCGGGWHNIKIAATPRRSAMFVAAAEALGLPASSINAADLDQDL